MIELGTAFLLGLMGSVHCAAMCGPLLLGVAARLGRSGESAGMRPAIYHAGRITAYCAIGFAFGLLGKSLVLAGLQRWLSTLAGSAVLIGLFLSPRLALNAVPWRFSGWLKLSFASQLRGRSAIASLALGAMNGLLPCGLVYVAAAGAAATGGLISGAEYMLVFGFGTLPMLLSLRWLGGRVQRFTGFNVQRLLPVSAAVMGGLLLLRGMALGIPYLSPDLAASSCSWCH